MKILLRISEEGAVVDNKGTIVDVCFSEKPNEHSKLLINGVWMKVLNTHMNTDDQSLEVDVSHTDYCYSCGSKLNNIRIQSISGKAYCSINCCQQIRG